MRLLSLTNPLHVCVSASQDTRMISIQTIGWLCISSRRLSLYTVQFPFAFLCRYGVCIEVCVCVNRISILGCCVQTKNDQHVNVGLSTGSCRPAALACKLRLFSFQLLTVAMKRSERKQLWNDERKRRNSKRDTQRKDEEIFSLACATIASHT